MHAAIFFPSFFLRVPVAFLTFSFNPLPPRKVVRVEGDLRAPTKVHGPTLLFSTPTPPPKPTPPEIRS